MDRSMPYDRVCKIFNILDKYGYTTKEGIQKADEQDIYWLLKESGYRFPKSTAGYIKKFGSSKVDLRKADREALCQIKGIGMKLASMFCNRTRGTQFAILDTHIIKWLKSLALYNKNYLIAESNFLSIASIKNMTPTDLDNKIWEENRRK